MADRSSRTFFGIYINGAQAEGTLKELRAESRMLKNEIANLVPGTEAYKRKMAELQGTEKWIRRHSDEVRGLNTVWSKVKTEVKAFGAVALAAIGANALFQGINNLIRKTGELSDVMADVRRTTGMTKGEVESLNKELSKIQTRSSRKELLELAKEAGKLGYSSVADVKKFVEQADQINVALGEDLGKDAIVSIGKLSNIFKTEMKNIASALNEVGQASVATEGWQVDFMMRMAGVAETVKLTLPDLLGYGAALENLGQTAEVSGTAMSQMFLKLIRDTEKFERIAGFANGELSKLIGEQGADEGMKAFINKLKESSVSTQDLAQKLDELGLDGVRSAGVLLSLANNTQLVAEQQVIANKAFEEGTSITNEFQRRQETFGATLDRLQKRLASIFLNNPITRGIQQMVTWFTDMLDPIESATEALEDERLQLNKMVIELTNVNTTQERRKELIDQIKVSYPDYLKYVDIDTASNEELQAALTSVNQEYAKKILLSRRGEDIADQSEREADAMEKMLESQSKYLEIASELNIKFGIAQKAGESAMDFYNRAAKELQNIIGDKNSPYTKTLQNLGKYANQLAADQKNYNTEAEKTIALQNQLAALQESFFPSSTSPQPMNLGEASTSTSNDGATPKDPFTKAAEGLKEFAEAGEPALRLVQQLATEYDKLAHAIANLNSNDDGYPALKNSMQDMNAVEQQRLQGLEELKQKEEEKIKRLEYSIELAVNEGMQIAENAATFKDATHEFLNMMRQRIKALLAEAVATYLKVIFAQFAMLGPIGEGIAVGLAAIGAATISTAFDKLVPSFAEGGFMDVTGAKNKQAYRAKVDQKFSGGYLTNPVLVGEAGLEYTVPSWMMNMPKVADTVGLLESIRSSGGTNATASPVYNTQNSTVNNGIDATLANEMTELLRELRQYGVKNVIGDRVIEELWKRKDLIDGLEKKSRN